MENAHLPQYGGAVVVDLFPGQAIVFVEGVDAAERDLDFSSRGWQAAPLPEMRAANRYFHKNRVVGEVLALDGDFQIG